MRKIKLFLYLQGRIGTVLLVLFVVCFPLYVISEFKPFPNVFSFSPKTIGAINSIVSTLTSGYALAYVFFFLTVIVPNMSKSKMIYGVIEDFENSLNIFYIECLPRNFIRNENLSDWMSVLYDDEIRSIFKDVDKFEIVS